MLLRQALFQSSPLQRHHTIYIDITDAPHSPVLPLASLQTAPDQGVQQHPALLIPTIRRIRPDRILLVLARVRLAFGHETRVPVAERYRVDGRFAARLRAPKPLRRRTEPTHDGRAPRARSRGEFFVGVGCRLRETKRAA